MRLNLLKIAKKRASHFFKLNLRIRETNSEGPKFKLSGCHF